MSLKLPLKSALSKLKIDKKTALFVVVGFTAILIIFFSEFNSSSGSVKEKSLSTEDMSSVTYCEYLEDKVKEIVESIEGAGKSKVMITLSETTEYIYATNDKDVRKSDDNSDDSTFENDYVIIENNSNDTGLLVKTIEPKVRGVAVVCEGGSDSAVQRQIYSAVSAVLNISTSRISISKLNVTEEK